MVVDLKLVDLWLPGLRKTDPDVLREAKCTLEMPPAQCLNSGISMPAIAAEVAAPTRKLCLA